MINIFSRTSPTPIKKYDLIFLYSSWLRGLFCPPSHNVSNCKITQHRLQTLPGLHFLIGYCWTSVGGGLIWDYKYYTFGIYDSRLGNL